MTAKAMDGKERESDRLAARHGEMLLKHNLLGLKIALLERNSGHLGSGAGGDEPLELSEEEQLFECARVCRS